MQFNQFNQQYINKNVYVVLNKNIDNLINNTLIGVFTNYPYIYNDKSKFTIIITVLQNDIMQTVIKLHSDLDQDLELFDKIHDPFDKTLLKPHSNIELIDKTPLKSKFVFGPFS